MARNVNREKNYQMNAERENHLRSIICRVQSKIDEKYTAGQAEHGGNLWEVPGLELLDNAIDEAIDQLAYLLTLRDKLVKLDVSALK